MAYEFVLSEREGPVGIVTINRPQQLNALSSAVLTELASALEAHDADPEVRVLILTGGTEVFAAGADLKEFASQSLVQMLASNRIALFDRIRTIGKPIIAAVSGYALGGGCEVAMLCDMIVASETARFGQPEISVGLMPGAGGTQRLTRTIGKAKAMEMVLTGAPIDAETAERLGLVNRVVPKDALLDEAKSLALKIAAKPPISVKLTKQAVLKAFELPLSEAVDHERKLFHLLFGTEDAYEGMNAFIEKRKPTFNGR
ncbi:MAG: enoyl-CoA hydratase/isomerase family protein [Chloroflexi bacterium]|nr:enoyl-CoA hydratase/isomerase family protein [Chloroflexota bacterium]